MTDSQSFRTVWISDLHLGTRACKARELAAFLRRTECERMYLVGDIIDGRMLRRSWYWEESHGAVIEELAAKARAGTRVTYLAGNHDEDQAAPLAARIGRLEEGRQAVHTTAGGRRLLVVHGDEFDRVWTSARWLAGLGDEACRLLRATESALAGARSALGQSCSSLASRWKRSFKGAVGYVDRFALTSAARARDEGFDGVVCGHVHQAETRELGGILYLNDGDWVESCTALVEHSDGRLEIVDGTATYAPARLGAAA